MTSSCSKRLLLELKELNQDPSPEFTAIPLERDLFEWHFTIRGALHSCYQVTNRFYSRVAGIMVDYCSPLNIPSNLLISYFLLQMADFKLEQRFVFQLLVLDLILLLGYHPESWMPAWGVRTALTALIGFMQTPGEGSVGAIEWSEEQRKLGAAESLHWVCPDCGPIRDILPSELEQPSRELISPLQLSPTKGMDSEVDLFKAVEESLKDSPEALLPPSEDLSIIPADIIPSVSVIDSTPLIPGRSSSPVSCHKVEKESPVLTKSLSKSSFTDTKSEKSEIHSRQSSSLTENGKDAQEHLRSLSNSSARSQVTPNHNRALWYLDLIIILVGGIIISLLYRAVIRI